MRVARRIVVFTGAGVSTASGIKDYRSGTNTRIKTGPVSRARAGERMVAGSSERLIDPLP